MDIWVGTNLTFYNGYELFYLFWGNANEEDIKFIEGYDWLINELFLLVRRGMYSISGGGVESFLRANDSFDMVPPMSIPSIGINSLYIINKNNLFLMKIVFLL